MFGDSLFETRTVGKAVVIVYSGNFENDVQNMSPEYITKAIDKKGKIIALDMSNIKKFLSVSITNIIRILRAVEKEGSKLYLLNVPEQVMKVLSMVNIIAKFNIITSDQELMNIQTKKGALKTGKDKVRFKISKKADNDSHTIAIDGSFVEGVNDEVLLEEIKCSISQGANLITLDFAKTSVLDSVSVGTLLSLHDLCHKENVKIRIKNANNLILHVLNTNQVGKLFGI
jgi:anti-anti-sigma factor